MSERPLLVLIDAHAVAYRQHFALRSAGFSTSAGEPTTAVYGFTRVILDILEESPEYFAISFDAGLSGREEVYEDYKANRDEMPEELEVQIERIKQLVETFNIPVLMVEGFEADDVIGTVAKQAEAQGCRVRIVTGDRDLLQLVTEHIHVQLPKRGEDDIVYDLAGYAEKYPGITPEQLTDLKGLMGDSSDNIPGVKGIGEKTGLKLLLQYGSVEGIYEHLDEIKGSQHKKLEAGRELAFLSKELATIKQDIPINIVLEQCATHDYDPFVVDALFEELEFRSHRRRLRQLHAQEPIADTPATEEEAAQEAAVPFTVVDTPEKLASLAETLNTATAIAFDTETTGVNQMQDYLVGIALAVDETHAYYIPLGHINPNAEAGTQEGLLPIDGTAPADQGQMQQASLLDAPPPSQLSLESVTAAIKPALTNPNIGKIAHNAKFDLVILRRYGIDVQPITYDTMIARWLLEPAAGLGLKDMAMELLSIKMTEITKLIGKGKKAITMSRVPIETAAKYAAADAALLFSLQALLDKELAEHTALQQLLQKVEMPLVPVIADMEMQGVLLDVDFMQTVSDELRTQIATLEQDIYLETSYGEFNINSTQQLADVLFGKLQLSTQGVKKTKSGNYSLTADTLERMRDEHPIIPKVLAYRQMQKLKSTYVDALPALVHPKTSRIHTSYNQTGTTTGRFSSSDPNLQNIPIRTEEGRRIRKAFIAPEGWLLLAADYSQIELRILAHYSGDESLIAAFQQGLDIHASTAAAVHRIAIEDVTYEQRSFAKSVNFGLMYGMGAFRLAQSSDLTLAEARDFIEAYFERFPGVKKYLDESKAFAEAHGYVTTLLGRRRNFEVLQNFGVSSVMRQRAEREAINMPIQGTSADILKQAILNLHAKLRDTNLQAHLILQVHDELVLEVAEPDMEATRKLVVETMESAYTLDVPLKVEAAVGKNWFDMEDIG